MECPTQTVRLDGNGRRNHQEDRSRAGQIGADQTRMHLAKGQKTRGRYVKLFERHYTSALDYYGGFTATYGAYSQTDGQGVPGPQSPEFTGFESINTGLRTYPALDSWV